MYYHNGIILFFLLKIGFNCLANPKYNFNWAKVFLEAKNKAIINEIDVEQRINSFPVEWLKNVNWLLKKPDINFLNDCKKKIANDFIMANNNSICKTNDDIFDAIPEE